MSADRDRGVRRVKQKRAKDRKKQERQQYQAGVAERDAAKATSTGKSA